MTIDPYLNLIILIQVLEVPKSALKNYKAKQNRTKKTKERLFFILLRKKRRLHIYCYWTQAILEQREQKEVQLQLY